MREVLKNFLTNYGKSVKINFAARALRAAKPAALAHLVERHLAKVEVASSSLVSRSILYFARPNWVRNAKQILLDKHMPVMVKSTSSVWLWKFSSAGRASALQAEGHRFEPCNFHHNMAR